MRLKTTRTIYNIALQTAKLTNSSYSPLPNTTLNEFFNNVVDMEVDTTPHLGYFMLGMSVNNIDNMDLYKDLHLAEHGNLFKPIPLSVRQYNNRLTAEESKNYRMQVVKKIDGKDYIFYFLKKLNSLEKPFELVTINFSEDEFNEAGIENFDNNKSNILYPELSDMGNIDNTRFHTVSKMVNVLISKYEKEEIKLATKLYYDLDSTDFKISEIALIHGHDVIIDNLPEVKDAQVSFFINTTDLLSVFSDLEPIDLTLNIGGLEMLKGT